MLTERFEVRWPPDLIERIDRWRNSQPIVPTRAAAIRRLIEVALNQLESKA